MEKIIPNVVRRLEWAREREGQKGIRETTYGCISVKTRVHGGLD